MWSYINGTAKETDATHGWNRISQSVKLFCMQNSAAVAGGSKNLFCRSEKVLEKSLIRLH